MKPFSSPHHRARWGRDLLPPGGGETQSAQATRSPPCPISASPASASPRNFPKDFSSTDFRALCAFQEPWQKENTLVPRVTFANKEKTFLHQAALLGSLTL